MKTFLCFLCLFVARSGGQREHDRKLAASLHARRHRRQRTKQRPTQTDLPMRKIAVLRSHDECVQKASLLGRFNRRAATIGDMLAGAGDELTSICFALSENARNLLV